MASKRRPSTGEGRYTLVKDNNADSFVIPVEKLEEWFAWLELEEDDPASWNLPKFARGVSDMLTFTDPQGLLEEDDLDMASDHLRFPRSWKEIREEVIDFLAKDDEFVTTSEVEAIVDSIYEREQNEG